MSENLLKDADASGVFHLAPSRLPGIEAAADRARFCLLKAIIAEHASVEAVLRQLGSALNFPIWYGANFDALYDCLTDPAWQPAKGHILLIDGLAGLRATDPNDFATLIEVLQAAAEARGTTNTPFFVLIDSPARGIPAFPEA
jgi:RNAse (barnase) inhibitor barstar